MKSKKRIGLVWSGSNSHKNDHNRSLKLIDLIQNLPNEFEYFSLQKEVRAVDQATLANSEIKHYGEQIADFSDTAALCGLMDLVISVDTSVAHLAGAIGKTTWVLLPHVPDWRWLLDRDDSPWYPSIKIYRQPSPGDWDSVIQRVRQDLIEYSNNCKL
jgi:ADP-heptose:LPS heptosyltransferase